MSKSLDLTYNDLKASYGVTMSLGDLAEATGLTARVVKENIDNIGLSYRRIGHQFIFATSDVAIYLCPEAKPVVKSEPPPLPSNLVSRGGVLTGRK